jgi:hypothetical protein
MKRSVRTWSVPVFLAFNLNAGAQPPYLGTANQNQESQRPTTPEEKVETKAHLEWMRLGPFALIPRITGMVMYDDNITIQSTSKLADVIWVISPGLTAIAGDTRGGTGRILTIDYSPSFLIFTEHHEFNAIDHAARLNGIWPFSRLTLGAGQTLDSNSGGVVDVGNRIRRKTYVTTLTSRYEIDEKASFEINLRQNIQEVPEQYNSSQEWSNDDWFNYQLSSKVTTGLGVTLGYLDAEHFAAQTYEQLLVRATYKVTFKVDLTASGGGELRQYGAGGGSTFGPIFSLGGSYFPWEGLSFNVEGHRRNQNSAYLVGQNYISTGFSLSARQRIGYRFFASLSGSYENNAYESAQQNVTATRNDQYYLVRAGLDANLTERWTAGLFYYHRTNRSEGAGALPFSNNQFGLQTSYSF